MGLFSSKSESKTENISNVSNQAEDNRIAADGGSAVVTNGSSFSTSSQTTIHNDVVDVGLVSAAQEIARLSLETSRAATDKATEAARQTTQALADQFGASLGEVARANKEALAFGEKTTSSAFDYGKVLTGYLDQASARTVETAERSIDVNKELAVLSIGAIRENSVDLAEKSFAAVNTFADELFTANQTSEERNFERISQLVTMVLVVVVGGYVATRVLK